MVRWRDPRASCESSQGRLGTRPCFVVDVVPLPAGRECVSRELRRERDVYIDLQGVVDLDKH